MEAFLRGLPKVELHLHIEGTFEPELMFRIASRNRVRLPYRTVDELRAAYRFTDLQSFLDIYYECASVLRKERDFHDLAAAYLERAAAEGVRHAEIFFDPQTHTARGVAFETVVTGLRSALDDARARLGISADLILCFLRHLTGEDAMRTLREALPFRRWIGAVGLDSSERGHPPSKFERVFRAARDEGFAATAHAGEEGPPSYIVEALDLLGARRIDHGVRCLEDEAVVRRLVDERVPLTVTPLSNVRLRVVDRIEDHPLRRMLHRGLRVTIHSDDPAYFGGYILENFIAAHRGLGLTREEIGQLSHYAIDAAFLPEDRRATLRAELDAYLVGG